MKLEIFNYVDEVLDLMEFHRQDLVSMNNDLKKYFNDIFKHSEKLLNISSRIKSQESLKEKLIRKNYFIDYPVPVDAFNEIPDLVGLRLECRFIKDEKEIYENIIEDFRIYSGHGYYASRINKNIELNLEEIQPHTLNNGFKIYKLDGRYRLNEKIYRFEIQIKSLVNVFWGEIDHKILYKNYNYMITEDFFRDIMNSILDNLFMVDKQLMILYNHVSSLDASAQITAEHQLKILLSKIIHDVFINKVREELGFVFNLKATTDIVVNFLFMKSKKNKDLSYGENFISLINRINEIANLDMNLEEKIVFCEPLKFYDDFTSKIGKVLEENINKDFELNVFFKIIYLINPTTYRDNFEDFLYFIRYEYTLLILNILDYYKLNKEEGTDVENYILSLVAENIKKDNDLDFIVNKSIEKIKDIIKNMKSENLTTTDEIKTFFKVNYNFEN